MDPERFLLVGEHLLEVSELYAVRIDADGYSVVVTRVEGPIDVLFGSRRPIFDSNLQLVPLAPGAATTL